MCEHMHNLNSRNKITPFTACTAYTEKAARVRPRGVEIAHGQRGLVNQKEPLSSAESRALFRALLERAWIAVVPRARVRVDSADHCVVMVASVDHRPIEKRLIATQLLLAMARMPCAAAECSDPRAANFPSGDAAHCIYDCVALRLHYFPEMAEAEAATKYQCFVYDALSGAWPAALLALRDGDKKIHVPEDESWVIQGLSNSPGAPVSLEARFVSGATLMPWEWAPGAAPRICGCVNLTASDCDCGESIPQSNASIVMRHIRFSLQDTVAAAGLASFLSYEGGDNSLLAFDHVVWSNWTTPLDFIVAVHSRRVYFPGFEGGVRMAFSGCTVQDSAAGARSAFLFIFNIWPVQLRIEDTLFANNFFPYGLVYHSGAAWCGWECGYVTGTGRDLARTLLTGNSSMVLRDVSLVNSTLTRGSGIMLFSPGSFPFHPSTWQHVLVDGLTCSGTNGQTTPCLLVMWQSGNIVQTYRRLDILDNSASGGGEGETHVVRLIVPIGEAWTFGELNQAQGSEGEIWNPTNWMYRSISELSHSVFENNVGGALAVDNGADGGFIKFLIHHVVFRGNSALLGGALYRKKRDRSSVTFESCLFEDNVAFAAGGAMYIDNGATVRDCVFHNNAVRNVPGDTLRVMVTVDLGNDVGVGTVMRPIWRIDEGLVFGNFTYFPNQLYVEVVELAVGRHTLHTGIEYSGQLNCRGEGVHCNYINKRWGRSTIQVATLDSVLVLPFEPHVNSYGTDANGNDVLSMIPETNNSDRIAAIWAETNQTQSLDEDHVPEAGPVDFEVLSGLGGAICSKTGLYDGQSIRIIDSRFSDNLAYQGSAIAAIAVPLLHVYNTTIDGGDTAVMTKEYLPVDCNTSPCLDGQYCEYLSFSLSCFECGINEISNGIVCSACPPGTQPHENRRSCVACTGNTFSTVGLCSPCEAGAKQVDHRACAPCPANQLPTAAGDRCVCDGLHYNTSRGGTIVCYASGEEWVDSGGATAECMPCPGCVACAVDEPTTVKPDFSVSTTAIAQGVAFDELKGQRDVFACASEGACIGTPLGSCSSTTAGPLCRNCATGFSRSGFSGPCSPCTETLGAILVVVVVIAIFGLLLALLYKLASLSGELVEQGVDEVERVVSSVTTLSKVWIGLAQIVSQLEFSMDVDWPGVFRWFVDILKLFSLDVLGLFDIGCVHQYDYYNKFTFAVLLMPALISGIFVIYLVETKAKKDDPRIVERCFQMALTTIFLSYPFVSSSIFQGFSCRSLGSNEQWLSVDFQINCDSDDYSVFYIFGLFAVAVFP